MIGVDNSSGLDDIELTASELKALRSILRQGAVSDEPLQHNTEPYPYLYRTKLIERFYSTSFPYRDRGELSIPLNALRVSDLGRMYLARASRTKGESRLSLLLSAIAVLISLAAFIRSFFP